MFKWLRKHGASSAHRDNSEMSLEHLFRDVPLTKSSWRQDVEDQRRPLPPSPVVSSITHYVSYPRTGAGCASYFSTWQDPLCLLRLEDTWDERIYRQLVQAVHQARVTLNVKAYDYPTYPLLQLVLCIRMPEYPTKPWFRETLGDISDGSIQEFVVDFCRRSRWEFVFGRYQSSGALDDPVVVKLSSSSSQRATVLREAQKAVAHYARIPSHQRNFAKAAQQFLQDDVPMEGIH